MPYSIASAPEDTAADGDLEFLIEHEDDGRWGSGFEPVRRGDRLAISGPLGSFIFPRESTEHSFLFIAGGTGISPLRSMWRHVLAREPGPGLRADGTRRRSACSTAPAPPRTSPTARSCGASRGAARSRWS